MWFVERDIMPIMLQHANNAQLAAIIVQDLANAIIVQADIIKFHQLPVTM